MDGEASWSVFGELLERTARRGHRLKTVCRVPSSHNRFTGDSGLHPVSSETGYRLPPEDVLLLWHTHWHEIVQL